MSRTWKRTSPPTENQLHVVAAQAAEAERRGLRAYANRLSASARRQRTRDRVSDMFPGHRERVAALHAELASQGSRRYALRLVEGGEVDA